MLTNNNFDPKKDESALFLLSAWHELFHGFTPDSYQPRLHNIPSLIEELVVVAELWQGETRFKVHAEKIKEELASAMKAESDLLRELPNYKTRCQLLIDAKTPQAIICQAAILTTCRTRYWDSFVKVASESIKGLPRAKADALTNVRRLATFAFQNGREDEDVWQIFENCEHQSAEKLFEQMVQLSQESSREYGVLLATIGDPAGMNSIARFRQYVVVSPKHLRPDFVKMVNVSNETTLYIRQNVKETSIRRAVALARKNVSVDAGLVSLYKNPDDGIRIHPAAVVSIGGQVSTFIQSEQAFRRLRPRRKASARIKDAANLVVNASDTDSRLVAAVEQVSLASARVIRGLGL